MRQTRCGKQSEAVISNMDGRTVRCRCCVSVCHIGSNLSGVYRMQLAPGHYVFVQTKSKLFKNSASGLPEFIMSTHSIVRWVCRDSKVLFWSRGFVIVFVTLFVNVLFVSYLTGDWLWLGVCRKPKIASDLVLEN